MFHVQLRQFPHNFCAFNLSETELSQTLIEPWSRGQWVELGERKWSPHQARLVVLEGPHLPVEELSMGRGWPTAQHQGEDVTERVIARAQASQQPGRDATADAAVQSGSDGGAPSAAHGNSAALDGSAVGSPDAKLLSLLGADPSALLQAWQLAARRRPELGPAESLALAEETLRSLDGRP
jgi:hypothetical protein